jgi:diphthamide synthase (EF-2-diphthine--ammonia ligase)
LAIRSMVAMAAREGTESFGLVLLTTFDTESRIIAHQDISIDTVLQQAQHLDISLLGIPMHRGSSESYVDRVRRGIQVLERAMNVNVVSLVFGDLHLEHIKGWRDKELSPLGYKLHYPLFGVPYDLLIQDLETSTVPCTVTSSTVPEVSIAELFNEEFRRALSKKACNVDLFGENGEFHTVAEVWKVDRNIALGLHQ